MAIKTFEHILILAKDIEVTKSFYVDILGLETGYRPNFPFHGYWLYVKNHSEACIHMAMQKSNDGQDYFIGTKQISDGTGPIDYSPLWYKTSNKPPCPCSKTFRLCLTFFCFLFSIFT